MAVPLPSLQCVTADRPLPKMVSMVPPAAGPPAGPPTTPVELTRSGKVV